MTDRDSPEANVFGTDDDTPVGEGAAHATPAPPPAAEPPTPAPQRVFVGTGFFWGLIIALVVATLVIILAAQNTASTPVTFLAWDFSMPVFVVILGSLLLGIVLAEMVGLLYRRRRRRILNERAELERLRSSGQGSPHPD